jgi:hypothetical protein
VQTQRDDRRTNPNRPFRAQHLFPLSYLRSPIRSALAFADHRVLQFYLFSCCFDGVLDVSSLLAIGLVEWDHWSRVRWTICGGHGHYLSHCTHTLLMLTRTLELNALGNL